MESIGDQSDFQLIRGFLRDRDREPIGAAAVAFASWAIQRRLSVVPSWRVDSFTRGIG